MRRGLSRSSIDHMSHVPQDVHFDLVLEIGTDPIRGRVGREPEALREFIGWIELAAALEAARTGPALAGHEQRGDAA
jgi:hypothetical protein